MNKILVIAPYSESILEAMYEYSLVSKLEFIVVGSKKMIKSISKDFDLKMKNCIFIDLEGEIDIALYAKEIVEKEKITNIIYGKLPYIYYQKIISAKSKQIELINIVDLKTNYLFISGGAKYSKTEIDDCKLSISSTSKLMKKLGLEYINTSIVYPKGKTDGIEEKIIKMIIKDLNIKNLYINDFHSLKDVFKNNHNVNLLVLKNFDQVKMLLECLAIFTNYNVCSLMIYNDIIGLDCEEVNNSKDVFFSLFIMDRLMKERKEKVS